MAKQKTPPAAHQQESLVNVILDRSGSMSSNRDGTIAGYNEYLNGLRHDKGTRYNVSLIQFDSPAAGPELTVLYNDKPLGEIEDLKAAEYEPRGSTPLYDAIGECIRRVEVKKRPVLTVIITDGMENASHEFSKESIKKLISEKEAEGWKFAFLGANIDSYAVGGALGVSSAYTSNYAPGMEKAMFSNLACATVARSANIQRHGLMQANCMEFFDNEQRRSMNRPHQGGRPAAPSSFPAARQRPNWSISGAVPGTTGSSV